MPQALAVPQKTGEAWVAMNDTDRVLRYLPACAQEDLVPTFICIEPEPSWAASSGETAATALALGLCGLDLVTALTGSATALGNVGPGLGPIIGPSGTFTSLPVSAKWNLSFAMLLGRLELITVLVLFSRRFWNDCPVADGANLEIQHLIPNTRGHFFHEP